MPSWLDNNTPIQMESILLPLLIVAIFGSLGKQWATLHVLLLITDLHKKFDSAEIKKYQSGL